MAFHVAVHPCIQVSTRFVRCLQLDKEIPFSWTADLDANGAG